MVDDDTEDLQQWRAGDSAAGERLFGRYYPCISRFFANKVAGDPIDLIQDTFVRCLHRREMLADPSRFRSYLFGIAYNVLREFYREQYASNETGEREGFDTSNICAAELAPGPGTMMAASEEQQLLLEGLRRIPIEHQVVLELFYWEGLTSAAIAEALDEPHGTIRTRIRRARQLLETSIDRLAADPGLRQKTVSDLDRWATEIRREYAGS